MFETMIQGDWWSQACRDVSQMLLTIYCGIFVFIAFQTWKVYSSRGQMAATMAGFELGKTVVRLFGEYWEILKECFKDPQKFKVLGENLANQIKEGISQFSGPGNIVDVPRETEMATREGSNSKKGQ